MSLHTEVADAHGPDAGPFTSDFSPAGPPATLQRPGALRRPRRRPSLQNEQVPEHMRPVLHLLEMYTRKIYRDGYLCKRDGAAWQAFFVELCGPSLNLWGVTDEASGEVAEQPSTINISNSTIEIVGTASDGVRQRTNIFALDAGQGDTYLLQAPDESTMVQWVRAIRLSCFEGSRLQEVYTATLLQRDNFRQALSGMVLVKGRFEGNVQVRFAGDREAKQYWVVVSDNRVEDRKKKDLAYARGQALFYENKRSKKPFMTLANVLQTYAIYPDNPTRIDGTRIFRVEGTFFLNDASHNNKPGDFALLTAESASEMAKWVVAFFDSFKLYGRPKELLYDFQNPSSPLFAVPVERKSKNLFLEPADVEHIDMRQSLADVKAEFAAVLRRTYQPSQTQDNNEILSASGMTHRKDSGQVLSKIITDSLDDRANESSSASTVSSASASSTGSRTLHQSSRGSHNKVPSLSGSAALRPAFARDRQAGPLPYSADRKASSSLAAGRPHATASVLPASKSPPHGRKGRHRQVASDDEDDEEESEDESESESDEDDEEYQDPTLLRNTQHNAKTLTSTLFVSDEDSPSKTAFTLLSDDAPAAESSLTSAGDLLSEVMSAFEGQKDESKQEEVTDPPNQDKPIQEAAVDVSKKDKPKRSVSFKNHPKNRGSKSRKQLDPLPSESEDDVSENSEEKSSDNEQGSDIDASSSKGNDETKEATLATKGSSKKEKPKRVRAVPQPSDSENDSEEMEHIVPSIQNSHPRTRESTLRQGYDGYYDGQYDQARGPYRMFDRQQQAFSERVSASRGYASGAPYDLAYPQHGYYYADEDFRPLGQVTMGSRNVAYGSNGDDRFENDMGKGKKSKKSAKKGAKSKKKHQTSKTERFGAYQVPVSDINLDKLSLDPVEANKSGTEGHIETSQVNNEGPETKSSESEDELKQTHKVVQPTKRKSKKLAKADYRPADSSEGSDVEEGSGPNDSEEEPLGIMVTDESGEQYYPPPAFGGPGYTPPRQLSPKFQSPQHYPGSVPGEYSEAEYLDPYSHSMLMPHQSEYYDDDHLSIASGMGGRPQSYANVPFGGRRHSNSGHIDFSSPDYGYHDDYYPPAKGFRPASLLGNLPNMQMSAREQEMKARETGAPLVQLEMKQKDPESGLVGAITARERMRRSQGPNALAQQAEIERERALDRERERRLMEQRQLNLGPEYMYARQSIYGQVPRSSRMHPDPYWDSVSTTGGGQRRTHYDIYEAYNEHYDEDDDMPLAVAAPSSGRTSQAPRTSGRWHDTE